ncbi:DUF6529 family protein [Rhizohabitans arisaemae]|uniref:DUF6529 family protein n=1 Tax=Rhizohabitans arisaemae TaxID=2720610 RepID=UPI0024B0539D|nr:DUF6529 family protein [Rhizohabitans arisaemae]
MNRSIGLWLAPLFAGGAVALVLGVYGRVHPPARELIVSFGFSTVLTMKVWFGTFAVLLAGVQVVTALAMGGVLRLPGGRRPWAAGAHRWSGRLAFLFTLPVAFHCLYSLGLQYSSPRVLVHSVVGCLLYGAFTTKMLMLSRENARFGAVAVVGGVVFAGFVGVWLTSSLWFFATVGIRV